MPERLPSLTGADRAWPPEPEGARTARAPDRSAEARAWHARAADAVLAALGTSLDGLEEDEAERRLARHGRNALPEAAPARPLALLLGQFGSLLVWLLIAAALVSGILGEWVDATAILAIVLLNAGLGFVQEYGAERALAALRDLTAPQARVRRHGRPRVLPAAQVVPGDILELEAGDIVSADARLLATAALSHVEAALTGESEPVAKHAAVLPDGPLPLAERRNMAYTGTAVAAGTATAVVVGTGLDTEIGRIAGLLAEATRAQASERTPLQAQLDALGRLLLWASLGIVALVFVLGFLRHLALLDLFLTSVSLAVAAVPEGLPAVVTIALAVGVQRMARRRALVRRLTSVETLGCTDVICSDKTGTLTRGEMTVRNLRTATESFTVSGEGYGPDGRITVGDAPPTADQAMRLGELLTVLAGCNAAEIVPGAGGWEVVGDPTEGALLTAAGKGGVRKAEVESRWPAAATFPFDADRKRMSVVRRLPDGRLRALVKGAPDGLLERCTHLHDRDGVRPLTPADRAALVADNLAMADRALRVLGAAYRDLDGPAPDHAAACERDLVYVGLAGMQDPPRPEATAAVGRCREAGIRVVMITGDQPRTALAIAREMGIAGPQDQALSGADLDALPDDALQARVPDLGVYARVTAAHKLRIVRAWRARGGVVAMTGDGVNDAPAIKGADIGIAMGRTGTSVTKEAADMVITDDDFASIVAAVEEGRGIYDNIRKTLGYLLGGNAGELLFVLACVVAGLPLPLLPVHLLWINLVTDGLPALCLATDPIAGDVMQRRPRRRDARITDGGFLPRVLVTGLLTAAVSLGAYVWMLGRAPLADARAVAFATLVMAGLLLSFGFRSEQRSAWTTGVLSNTRLLLVVCAGVGLQVWSHHAAWLGTLLQTGGMATGECLLLLPLAAIPLAGLEVFKHLRRGTP